MESEKRYGYVVVPNVDEVIRDRRLKEGEKHKFGPFRKAPETWYVDGFPGIDQWKTILNMALYLVPNGSSGLMLRVGKAKLNAKDSYDRKEGIRVAKEKAQDNLESFVVRKFTACQKGAMGKTVFSAELESDKTRMFVEIYESGRPRITCIYSLKDEIHYY